MVATLFTRSCLRPMMPDLPEVESQIFGRLGSCFRRLLEGDLQQSGKVDAFSGENFLDGENLNAREGSILVGG